MGLFPAGSIHPRHLALRVVRRRNMVVTWPASVVFGAFDRRQRIDLYYRDSNPAHEAEVVGRTRAVKHGIPNAVEAGRPLRGRGGDCLRGDLLPLLRSTANGACGLRWWRRVVSMRDAPTSERTT